MTTARECPRVEPQSSNPGVRSLAMEARRRPDGRQSSEGNPGSCRGELDLLREIREWEISPVGNLITRTCHMTYERKQQQANTVEIFPAQSVQTCRAPEPREALLPVQQLPAAPRENEEPVRAHPTAARPKARTNVLGCMEI